MKLWAKVALTTSLFIMPMHVYAYSDTLILGGDNIGIHIESDGVMIIGFYKVNGALEKGNPSLEIGDKIIKVGNIEVNTVSDLTKAIDKEMKEDKVKLTVLRNNKEKEVELKLTNVSGSYKTGLYVKDGITGIGTLTYIDPETKIYGSLGHEILESTTKERIEVKTGSIFESSITGIIKSSDGVPGEKNASFNQKNVYGTISKNTEVGLFGQYTKQINGTEIPIAKKDEVKVGKAYIYTVLNGNEKEKYEIEIKKINRYNQIKNIQFEITDKTLLEKTGGVVQGMSGSPIIQEIDGEEKIIGAVTHVIVDNVKTGYGVFIETMLEEGEK